jgi:flagellar hook-associated protein 2
MPAIQSLGVGSGLDANAIVTQLLAIERQPITRLQKAATGIQAEISAFGNVTAKLDSLESASNTLKAANTWTATKSSSSDTSALTVSAQNTAEPVTLDVQVTSLAKAQSASTAAGAFATSATAIGTIQTLSISVGKWVAGSLTDPSPVDVSLLATDTLAQVRDKINAAAAGVAATILNDANGARLVIRSDSTGAGNAFKITSDAGGSPFSFTVPAAFDQTATDLTATVNGAAITSSSNTVTNLVEGVTVTALKTTSSAVKVSVEKDLEGVKSKLSAFVTAYNDLMSYLRQQTSYNEATKTGATLQGDRLAVGLQGQLKTAVIDTTAASATFSRLSEVGIRLQKDGSLSLDSSVLDSKLQSLDEVTKLFSRDDASAANDGVAVKLADFIDSVTGTEGSLTQKTAALRSRLNRNQNDQEKMTDRLALIEARLRAQYTALDKKMAGLSGLSSYVSQQVQLMNKSTTG